MNACTLWPDRMFGLDWSHCCVLHDVAYDLHIDKLQADRDLYTCVAAVTHMHGLAAVMFAGVTLFGRWFWTRRGGRT